MANPGDLALNINGRIPIILPDPCNQIPVAQPPSANGNGGPVKKTQSIAKKIFDFFENVVWKYIKEANNVAKRVIKIIAVACAKLAQKLNAIISKLGILSAISVLFSLKSTYSAGQSLSNSIKLKDGEGIAFSAINLLVNPLDALDSLITTMGALASFGVVPAIAFFGLIALPLAIGLSCYGAIKSVYDLIVSSIAYHCLPKSIDDHNEGDVKNYIEKKIGITTGEQTKLETKYAHLRSSNDGEYEKKIEREVQIIKDRKRAVFTRHTDAKVYNIMRNMQKQLNSGQQIDKVKANLALKDMKTIMVRKIGWNCGTVLTNIAMTVTLACSAVFPFSAFVGPGVAGIRALFTIAKHNFDHVWLYKGLRAPEYLTV